MIDRESSEEYLRKAKLIVEEDKEIPLERIVQQACIDLDIDYLEL